MTRRTAGPGREVHPAATFASHPTRRTMSTPVRRPLRILGAATAALALALTAAACGSDDSTSDTSSTASTTAGAAKAPGKIVIAYQAIPNGDLVVKHEKWLEQAFPDTDIQWKLFESGGDVNQAIAAGSVDIGLAGSSPVSRGLSTPIPYQVPWIFDVIGTAEALAVKSDVKSLADLKGKKIATPLASTSHYSLLAALAKAGLTEKDVKIIDAEPDAIAAAWSRGDIDGAYVWNPNLATILKDGGHTLITSADLAKEGKTTYDLAVATNSFAGKYPAALNTWAAQQDKAVSLLNDEPDKAAADIAAELNISPADAAAQAKGLIFVSAKDQVGPDYLGGGLATNLYAAAQFNQKLGQIPKVAPEADYQNAVKTQYAASVK
jgi:taurine transport system substrate-binding protein